MNNLDNLKLEFAVEISRECADLFNMANNDHLDSRDITVQIMAAARAAAVKYQFSDFGMTYDLLEIALKAADEIRRFFIVEIVINRGQQ